MDIDHLCEAMERCFISPNVSDSNFEPANMVDTLDRAARNLYRVAHAITPQDASPAKTPDGGRVGSLTEAVFYAAENLGRIASAIEELANAMMTHGA